MTEKKEIKVKKSLLTLILKSVALSILTLFIIQHFGKISGGGQVTDGSQKNYGLGKYLYTQPFKFENPINGKEYYENYNPSYGISKGRKGTYWLKFKEFYIPSLLSNPLHILVATILFGGVFAFFGNYKLKIS